jgi:hypothetical protein
MSSRPRPPGDSNGEEANSVDDDCNDRARASSLFKRLDLCDEDGEGFQLPVGAEIHIHEKTADGEDGREERGLGDVDTTRRRRVLLCDLGYGFPREERPRREKVLAVAKQLVTFLEWRQQQQQLRQQGECCSNGREKKDPNPFLVDAQLVLVHCLEPEIRTALTDRMSELWNTNRKRQQGERIKGAIKDTDANRESPSSCEFPADLVEFATEGLPSLASSSSSMIYLSPDSDRVLDASLAPPDVMVVGMLIDRRVQPGRSLRRAEQVGIKAARLPLERVGSVILDRSEPLNVDCILEGLQQWHWNCDDDRVVQADPRVPERSINSASPEQERQRECFERAFAQALQHHQDRHPERPVHKTR